MTSDKRNHERFSYEHQALLVVPGFAPVGCQMANVCAGGMWLSDVASVSLLEHLSELLSRGQSQWAEVHLFCATEGGEEHYALASEVRRCSHDGIGLRFIESQDGLVDTLRNLSRKLGMNRLNYVPKKQRVAGLEQFIARAEAGFARLLTIFLMRFFDASVTGLAGAAPIKATPAKVAQAKVATRKKTALHEVWAESLRQIWQQRLQTLLKSGSGAVVLSELSVVDKNKFENWLELQLVTNRVSDLYKADIFRLNQYLGHLLRQPVDDRHNPLSPTSLCQLLHDFEEQEGNLDKTQQTLLNSAFEDTLADNLAPLYQELSELFERMGLRAISLSSLRASAGSLGKGERTTAQVVNSEAVATDSGLTETPAATLPAAPNVEPAKPGNVVNLLQAFSGRARAGDEDQTPAVGGRTPGDSRQIALSALRSHRQQVQSLSVTQGSPLQQIMGQITAGDLDELPHEVTDRLQIVDQVLVPPEHCENDLQALMLALKGPLAEILLEDDEFLINPGHPVRRLVNLFFRLINSDSSVSRQSKSLLSEVVLKLGHSIDDTEVIQQLTTRLEESLQRQQRIFEHTAERISRKHEGQDRLQRARVKVGQRLDALFGQSKIPLILDNLLDSGWQHKLVMEVLREGEDGPLVARDLARIKEFSIFLTGIALDTLAPEVELERASRKVLNDVASELRESYKPLEANAAIDELKALLADPSLVEFVQYRSRMPENDTGEPSGNWQDDEGLDRWLDRVAVLKPGDWLEYTEAGRHLQRLRLVWSDEEAIKFVFITEQGLQEKQMSLESVALAMRDGHLTLASQAPEWIDKCLFQLVNDLYGKMAFQALHDPLTGCIYRHEMEKHLDFCLVRCKTDHTMAALIWLDIDQFRVVNNGYGTAIGDRLLQQTGRLFDAWLDSSVGECRLGRMGGNEFALLLHPSDYPEALDKAQKLIRQFGQHEFDFDGVKLFASISAGVMLLNADSPYAGDIINRVSLACGVAKSKGGNQVHIYRETDAGQQQQQQLFDWARRIDQLVGENRLNLRAQKIQPAPDQNAWPKYEILLDMPQEDGKQISPQAFVEAAERLRRSVLVDRWVVHRVLEWMRQNPVKLAEISELTINLSGLSMSDDEFLHFLENEFRQGGFPPEKVCFELTETAAVASIHYTVDFIRTLRQFYCRFALDDFGTGFSSYAYLQSMPVDYLKIDGIFIRDIDTNMTNYAMVKSITELGQYLGMGVIAECIENQATADAVVELGVQWLQGWHIEKPRPLSSL